MHHKNKPYIFVYIRLRKGFIIKVSGSYVQKSSKDLILEVLVNLLKSHLNDQVIEGLEKMQLTRPLIKTLLNSQRKPSK